MPIPEEYNAVCHEIQHQKHHYHNRRCNEILKPRTVQRWRRLITIGIRKCKVEVIKHRKRTLPERRKVPPHISNQRSNLAHIDDLFGQDQFVPDKKAYYYDEVDDYGDVEKGFYGGLLFAVLC